jgi:hypothetical protein
LTNFQEAPVPTLEHIWEAAARNNTKAAERSSKRHNKKSKPVEYSIGDVVFVKNFKPKKGDPIFPYEAKIVQKTLNHRYKLEWIKQRPNIDDKPGTKAKEFYPTRMLRKFVRRFQPSEEEPIDLQETLAPLFSTPERNQQV